MLLKNNLILSNKTVTHKVNNTVTISSLFYMVCTITNHFMLTMRFSLTNHNKTADK